jgi:hypothetical protein
MTKTETITTKNRIMEKKEFISEALDYISELIDENATGREYVRIKLKGDTKLSEIDNVHDVIYESEYSSIQWDSICKDDIQLCGFEQDGDYNEEEEGDITFNSNYQSWKSEILEEIRTQLEELL